MYTGAQFFSETLILPESLKINYKRRKESYKKDNCICFFSLGNKAKNISDIMYVRYILPVLKEKGKRRTG